jgi:hypothetical protein
MVAAYMQNSLYVEALALFLQLNLAGWLAAGCFF